MSKGDLDDNTRRLKSLSPPWFASDTPGRDAVLSGMASAFAWIWDLITYVISQTRLKTMTGVWLDLFSLDFFGTSFFRRKGELDDRFRNRIKAELFRERTTRAGMIRVVAELTGRTPILIEAWNPADVGGYDIPVIGYDVAGFLGTYDPYQFFMQTFESVSDGVPRIAGYDVTVGGYDVGGQLEYAGNDAINSELTSEDIFGAVDRTRAAGVTAWTQISAGQAMAGGLIVPVNITLPTISPAPVPPDPTVPANITPPTIS